MGKVYDEEYAFVHAHSGNLHYFWGIDPSCELYYGDKIKITTATQNATYNKNTNVFETRVPATYHSHTKVEVISVLRFTKDKFEREYNKIINATYFEHIIEYELLERGTTLLHDLGFSYVFNRNKKWEPQWVLDGHKVDNVDAFLDNVVLIKENPKIYYYSNLEWYIYEGNDNKFHVITSYEMHDAALYGRTIFNWDGTPCVTFERTDPAKIKEEFSKAANLDFKEENNSMFDNIFNKYSFGEIKDNRIAYTTEGLAFRDSAGDYIVYKDGAGINMNQFKMDLPLFKIPVSIKDIQSGDIIVHFAVGDNAYLLVEEVKDNGIVVIDPQDKTRKEIVPERNIFGFDFIPKVIAPITADAIKANEENPFGNLLPFLMMSDSNNNNDIMMFMMMQNGSFELNPMMLMMMDKSNNNNDLMKYMMISQMMNPAAKN